MQQSGTIDENHMIHIVENRIDDLCMAVADRIHGNLGIHFSTRRGAMFSVRSLPQLQQSWSDDVVSLRELLENGVLTNVKERLQLGIILTSAAMQLYDTPWVDKSWDSANVFFRQTRRVGLSGIAHGPDVTITVLEPVVSKPLLRHTFEASANTETPSLEHSTAVRKHDGYLRSLGLILIELWFGRLIWDVLGL